MRGGFRRGLRGHRRRRARGHAPPRGCGTDARLPTQRDAAAPRPPRPSPRRRVPCRAAAPSRSPVDAYADAALLPRTGSVSGSVQTRQGQDLTYVAASAETREGVYHALKTAGFPPSNTLLQNEFWAEHSGDTQPLAHSGVMLPAGSPKHVVDLLLSDQWPVVHDDAQPFMSVRAAGDLLVFTASHPEPDLSLVDQTRAVMRQLDAGLSRHGLTWAQVVKVSAPYVGGGTEDDLHQNLKIRHSYHVRPGPASTGLPVRAFAQTGTRICVQLLAHR